MDLPIWEREIPFYLEGADTPNTFHTYFAQTDRPLPCIVVLAGGGYGRRADHEGEPVAQFFQSRGLHAVVVDYRVAPNRHPAPLADVQRVVRILRSHAQEWMIDPQRIVCCGFSAGGHLCASSILLPDVYSAELTEPDETDRESCMPNGSILCYAVISLEDGYGHIGSGKNLLGAERYEKEKADLSLVPLVKESTPKVFLWHTSNDAVVNVKNSLLFAEQLRENNIEFELHVFPHGHHGLGLASDRADVSGWADLAANWVKRNI